MWPNPQFPENSIVLTLMKTNNSILNRKLSFRIIVLFGLFYECHRLTFGNTYEVLMCKKILETSVDDIFKPKAEKKLPKVGKGALMYGTLHELICNCNICNLR